jgi:XTP/dITP diphosphohydrolase
MDLVIATRNAHKLDEIQAIFSLPSLTLFSSFDFPAVPDVDETGVTFVENATLKATALSRATGLWAMGDDSGLEVDALGGAPGVYSARYAGLPTVDYAANNQKLLRELDGITDRRARFRTVLALASPDGRVFTVEGRCDGVIAEAPRGRGGFGYDPLFIPDGETLAFAEMPAEQKNRISHRARALAAAVAAWKNFFQD